TYFNEQRGSRSMARRIRLQTNAAAIAPGFTDDRVEWRNTANTTAAQEIINTPKFARAHQIGFGGKHRLERWTIDYSADASQAATYYDSAKYRRGSMSPIIRGVGVILDRSNTGRHFPTVTQTSGPDIYDLASYTAAPFNHRDQRAEDEVYNAQVNVARDVMIAGHPLALKFGARYRSQERMAFQRNRRFNYLGPDGRANSGDEGLERYAEDRSYALVEGRYPAPRWLSVQAVGEALAANPSWFQEDVPFHETNRLANDREIQESVTAGYVMGNLKLGQLSILAGLRYEATEVEGSANLHAITPAEAARRAAFTGTVTTEESVRRIRAEYATRVKATSEYDRVFPGLHLRFEPRRGLLFRASYSTSIGRPNFGSIVPDTDVNYLTQVVITNNTDLQPQFGKSINAGVQYYFEPVGVLSANVFYTKISDFIFSATSTVEAGAANGFDGEYAGFELRSQANGGSAAIKGVELSYNQQLVFLPGFLRNFGVFGNYTYLKTSGNYGGSAASPTTQLVGFVPESANAGLSFSDFGLEVRVKGTYKGEWLTAYNANPGAVRYTESRFNTDLNVLYRLTRRYSVFVDWVNIFNTFDPDYQYRDTLIRTYIPSGSRVNAGVRARF
ncbi:MAG: TonB-dependent receptor domain-containing protein, partial [Opitutaceae bacterium]